MAMGNVVKIVNENEFHAELSNQGKRRSLR